MPVLRSIQSEEHQTPGGTRLEDDFLLKGAKPYARNNKPQALQVGLGRGPTRIPDQEHLGRGLCAPAMLGREKLAGNRYNAPADQRRPGALAQAQSTAHDPRGDIRRIWKPRPPGGRLQTGVQRAEGCFIYFSICWLLVVALAHVRQAQSGGGVAQAHRGREGADLPAWLGAASRCLCVVCSPGHPSAGLWTTSSVAYCSDLQKGGRFAALGFNHLLLQPWQQLPEICYAELWQCPLPLQLQF